MMSVMDAHGTPAYLHPEVGGSVLGFPNHDDPLDVEWALRYGTLTREQELVAASFISAYKQLVAYDSQRSRNAKVSALRDEAHRVRGTEHEDSHDLAEDVRREPGAHLRRAKWPVRRDPQYLLDRR